ncbi:SDR family oxidoreductase [Nocardioides daeguensis]|uniref:NAD(P)-binding domain-containing protein n=1 Tax=Nocardioides daeguensis TaxID=908359 RepID=A0ABP6W5Q3_9ACTN|nr:NmrA family NAD(P)-binding protein [Nocardioides daeguensis]MBV6727768.1 NAD(P)H-binding protein [Nocardioides daeguensis]MCR1775240.1 NAD(P)H-binding protein [Nocardioides daeguensis]
MKVAILGGSGKTGRAVGAALAQAGVATRPLGRAAFDDLPAALAGADAVHVIAPNLHPDEPAYVATVLAAATGVGVGRVSYHSVASPYVPAMPHHLGKAESEDLVRRSGLDWTILQPCAYLQNLLPGLRTGTLDVPYSVDTLFGMVDLRDVAAATAAVLTGAGHVGATYELGGPALVSVADVAAAAGTTARRIPAGADVHPWLRAMFDYYDAHGLPTGGVPLAALLGRRPASVADVLARELPAGRCCQP